MNPEKRIEIEVGWLKVVFTVLMALDATLTGWLFQNYQQATTGIITLSAIGVAAFSIVALGANYRVYYLLKQAEELS